MRGELEALLSDAVALRMAADVPVGAFLSGGVDSSTVVALMQKHACRPVPTFTIGFGERGFDEASHARAVARYLGTQHTEFCVTPLQAAEVIPSMPILYDEPFADPSQIPTFLVSRLARTAVKVALSGDGGDELFGGYTSYSRALRLWELFRRVPRLARCVLSQLIAGIPTSCWPQLCRLIAFMLPEWAASKVSSRRIQKFARLLAAANPDDLFAYLAESPTPLLTEHAPNRTESSHPVLRLPRLAEFVERMMLADFMSYLPDDILVKVDRAAMGVSLETRLPFLDHRVIEFAWQLPVRMKLRGGRGKWILRQLLYKYVPRELVDRPKRGFGVPLGRWLRGPLREWAEDLLAESRLRREGWLNWSAVRRIWRAHLAGADETIPLWNVLMFEAWLDARCQFAPCSSHMEGAASP